MDKIKPESQRISDVTGRVRPGILVSHQIKIILNCELDNVVVEEANKSLTNYVNQRCFRKKLCLALPLKKKRNRRVKVF